MFDRIQQWSYLVLRFSWIVHFLLLFQSHYLLLGKNLSFLMLMLIAIDFPHSTSFDLLHKFWYVLFPFLFIWRNFLNFPFVFLNISSFAQCHAVQFICSFVHFLKLLSCFLVSFHCIQRKQVRFWFSKILRFVLWTNNI
jgi:hypothetical protein